MLLLKEGEFEEKEWGDGLTGAGRSGNTGKNWSGEGDARKLTKDWGVDEEQIGGYTSAYRT